MSRGRWKRAETPEELREELARDAVARAAEVEPPSQGLVYGEAIPSDAEKVEDVIDRAVKRMLVLTVDPKEMAKAVEAATKWVATKNKISDGEEWGSKLGGGAAHVG